MTNIIDRRKEALFIGPHTIYFDGEEIGLWLAFTRLMIHTHAIVVSSKGKKIIDFFGTAMPTEPLYLFAPSALGIETYRDFSAPIIKFAQWCVNQSIYCVFIDGDFAQSQQKTYGAGYGFVRCDGKEKDMDILHTMDFKKAISDNFLKWQFGGVSLKR